MQLFFSPEAQKDLHGIKTYISLELENPDAASNTISKIMNSIRKLSEFPEIGANLGSILGVQTNYRYLISGKYISFYRYQDDTVYIVRILYGKRDYLRILFDDLPEE